MLRHTAKDSEFLEVEVTTDVKNPEHSFGAMLDKSVAVPAERESTRERYKRSNESIGEGANADVIRADDAVLGGPVALKILKEVHLTDAQRKLEQIKKFKREGHILARIRHPHVLSVRDMYDSQDGIPCLVTEYIDGQMLDRLASRGLSLCRVRNLVRQLCSAVTAVHDERVVHRDIKPGNIMVVGSEDIVEHLVLMDFGESRSLNDPRLAITANRPVGTPAYMSPEQCRGRDATPQSDIYSMGVTIFEMVTGHLPFTASTLDEVFYMHCYETPPSPSTLNAELPSEASTAILRALAKDPSDRQDSPIEFVKQFEGGFSDASLLNLRLQSRIQRVLTRLRHAIRTERRVDDESTPFI